MVGEITTMMITYWTMQFAVGKRAGLTKQNVLFLFVAITYCLKLSGLIYYIVEELMEVELAVRKTITKVLSVVNETTEDDSKMTGNIASPNLRMEKFGINGGE